MLDVSDKPVVFFISPEVAPFAKTGGLADVAGSLPSALHRLGVEVAVGLPFYRLIKEENLSLREKIPRLEVPLGEEVLACKVLETKTAEGIPVYFFDREDSLIDLICTAPPEGDYYDNFERFCFFSRAVLLFAKKAGLQLPDRPLPRLADRACPCLSSDGLPHRPVLREHCDCFHDSQPRLPGPVPKIKAGHQRDSSKRVQSGRDLNTGTRSAF